jgi:hypothetical protein
MAYSAAASLAPMLAGIDPDKWKRAMPALRGYAQSRDAGGPYDLLNVLAVADGLD